MAMGIGIVVLAFVFRDAVGFLQDQSVTIGVLIFSGLPFIVGLYQMTLRLIDYLYDEDVITNQRVIDYNQKFFFSKEQSTAHLKTIENVNLIQDGIFRSLFNYGTLQVQTAASDTFTPVGQKPRFLLLDDVRNPRNIQRLIDELASRVKEGRDIDKEELLQVCGLK